MTRRPTLLPADKTMWRKLLFRVHPATGGSHGLLIWTGSIKELVCGSEVQAKVAAPPQPEPCRSPDAEPTYIPYPRGAYFAVTTRRAVAMAEKEIPTYGRLLRPLAGYYARAHLHSSHGRGAGYKRLAPTAHTVRMSKERPLTCCRFVKSIPLSDCHAGCILDKLKEQAT